MRVFNFSPGPAVLPQEVLEQAREELLDWHGTGMSVMEMSHRGKAFVSIAETAEADLRELLAVPKNYKVLFLQGGATAQFAAVPLNLSTPESVVDYVNTGSWSKKAHRRSEALRASVNVAADAGEPYTSIPPVAELEAHAPTRPICTTRRTRRSAASNSTSCRTSAACRWSPTCRRRSCRGRSTSRSSA